MDVDSFLHMGYVGEDCLFFIIPHPLAQEMRESRNFGSCTFLVKWIEIKGIGLFRFSSGAQMKLQAGTFSQ